MKNKIIRDKAYQMMIDKDIQVTLKKTAIPLLNITESIKINTLY